MTIPEDTGVLIELFHWMSWRAMPKDFPIELHDVLVLSEGHKLELISFNPSESAVLRGIAEMAGQEMPNRIEWHLRMWCSCHNSTDAAFSPMGTVGEKKIRKLFDFFREDHLSNDTFVCIHERLCKCEEDD